METIKERQDRIKEGKPTLLENRTYPESGTKIAENLSENNRKENFLNSIKSLDDVKERLWSNLQWSIAQNEMVSDLKRAIRESIPLFLEGKTEEGIKRLYKGGIAEIWMRYDDIVEYETTGKIKRYDETGVDYKSNLDEIRADLAKGGIQSRR